ncbi:MAG: response regulator [Deltaproteobacteria bacterium]|nr:response regulator [Deltaproteobacteria bacterium]
MFFEESPLKDLTVLVVDDETDMLEAVEDELMMCILHKASDYETALQYLLGYKYDIVILDIMGVRGFDLLRVSVSQGFPTVIFTAYALTMDALKKTIQLGAVFFLPKEKLPELKDFLEKLVRDKWKSNWMGFFDRLGFYFSRHFGPDWKEKDKFFKEFEESLIQGSEIKKDKK